jgi:hypothetical protein
MQIAANLKRLGTTDEVERIFRRSADGADELEELRIDGDASVRIGKLFRCFWRANTLHSIWKAELLEGATDVCGNEILASDDPEIFIEGTSFTAEPPGTENHVVPGVRYEVMDSLVLNFLTSDVVTCSLELLASGEWNLIFTIEEYPDYQDEQGPFRDKALLAAIEERDGFHSGELAAALRKLGKVEFLRLADWLDEEDW